MTTNNKTVLDSWTIACLLDWTQNYFLKNGIENGRLDAELLLSSVIKCKRMELTLNASSVVLPPEIVLFKSMIERRRNREPIAYILGNSEFMGLNFLITKETLVPRSETEILVEAAAEEIKNNNLQTAIDMCTGSGNIAVSLAKLTNLKTIYACDISKEALLVANKNAANHGVLDKVVTRYGDLFNALEFEQIKKKVEIVISNPPYISQEEFSALAPELLYEPKNALLAGEDATIYYRRIFSDAREYLCTNGLIIFELSATKSKEIVSLADYYGYKKIKVINDYAGLERVFIGRLNG